eukprot:477369_1
MFWCLRNLDQVMVIGNHLKMNIMYIMIMEMIWNGHRMIIWPCCCSFIMVLVVIRWLVMDHLSYLKWLRWEILCTYKRKEVKRLRVPAEDSYIYSGARGRYTGGRSYKAYSSDGGASSYTGGEYTGCGSYGEYSGHDGQAYSGGYCGLYRGHSGG